MPEDDYFKEDFNSYFWFAAAATFGILTGLDNEGYAGWIWLGLGGLSGLMWLSAMMLGASYRDKRKAYQRAMPWAIWGVLGGASGVGGFMAIKGGIAWFRAANLSPTAQVLIGMLAVIIVQLFYINLELERIRKRPMPTSATPPR